jgi:hypothetical protein
LSGQPEVRQVVPPSQKQERDLRLAGVLGLALMVARVWWWRGVRWETEEISEEFVGEFGEKHKDKQHPLGSAVKTAGPLSRVLGQQDLQSYSWNCSAFEPQHLPPLSTGPFHGIVIRRPSTIFSITCGYLLFIKFLKAVSKTRHCVQAWVLRIRSIF